MWVEEVDELKTISDLEFFFFPSGRRLHYFFFHRAGFINNTLHSQQGYILNSKLAFNSQFTFTRIGTF